MPLYVLVLLTTATFAQQIDTGTISQKGDCNDAGVIANSINCGVPPAVVKALQEQHAKQVKELEVHIAGLQAQLKDQKGRADLARDLAASNRNLAELLTNKDAILKDLEDKYRDLQSRFSTSDVDDARQKEFESLLSDGKLDEARRLLDKVIEDSDKKADQAADRAAKRHFESARLYELQFQPLKALPDYEKAWNHRPDNPNYGDAYARLLYQENDFRRAQPVFEQVVRTRKGMTKTDANLFALAETQNRLALLYLNTRQYQDSEKAFRDALGVLEDLAKSNPRAYLPAFANVINHLGSLYRTTQQLNEAANVLGLAIVVFGEIEKYSPGAYQGDWAMTLGNLGNVYRDLQHWDKATDAYGMALMIFSDLATVNPGKYQPLIAQTQNNLGVSYYETKQFENSADAYAKARGLYRDLAKSNPEAFQPYLAIISHNLGNLYRDTQQLREASDSYSEALLVRRDLAKENPDVHKPEIQRTLKQLTLLYLSAPDNTDVLTACTTAASVLRRLAADHPAQFGQIPPPCQH